MIETSRNILRPCECGCKTPIIEESTCLEKAYRVVCPECKNGEEMYLMDSLEGVIMAWNNELWKWMIDWRKFNEREKGNL
jgi:hypothetical protein